jgi:uncharacterized protein YlxW (UPF0749 family)
MNRRNILILFLVGVLLGDIFISQFYLAKKLTKVTQVDENASMAIEVGGLIDNTEKLQKEINELAAERDKLIKSTNDHQTTAETLEKDLSKYKIIAGETTVEGPGVVIIYSKRPDPPLLLDLINALRNIGVEAFSINEQRIVINSKVDYQSFAPPYNRLEIKAIGNPELLKNALTRRGGVIEMIGIEASVEKKDNLVVPAKK